MKMLISEEWMRRKILEDGDGDIEAGMPLDSETAMGKRLSDDPGPVKQRCIDCGSDLTFHQRACRFYPNKGAIDKRLYDDPGLAEMQRMEYLMSKAPCVARLKELAAWSAKDD